MSDLVYIPSFTSGNCAYIYNSDVIRVYNSVPTNNSTIAYKDYYIHSNYIYNTGSTTFNQYSSLPTCISSDRITTDVNYRTDIVGIYLLFFMFAFACLWLPWKLLTVMFRRWHH